MAFGGGRGWLTLLLTAGLYALAGCTQNPSYFPYLLPMGPITQTHARPIGHGYYANFDPHAVRLEVRPLSLVNPVGTQHVVLATVYDEANKPRRQRRVEWMVEGVGNIIEVDESGCHSDRGYKVDNKYAVSYTNFWSHVMTRGNLDPRDDFQLNPGQTWCVVSSAVEGDTYITAYAPEINNWDRRKMTVNVKWVDAFWIFPESATARTGTQHVFTTKVFKNSTKEPLVNYRVRYTILPEGPPAVLLPTRSQERVTVSDLNGHAQVAIAQQGPAAGVNKIEIEIIRPPDPTKPSGVGVTLAKAFTTIEWLAPNVAMAHTGPADVPLGQEAAYTIAVTSTGKIESRSMTVTNPIPPGLEFVRSTPPAIRDGNNLVWTLGPLPPGQMHTVQPVFKAVRPGPVNNVAAVVTEEGLKDEKTVVTQVTEPRLTVDVKGPQTGVVGAPATFEVSLTNPGSGAIGKVLVKVDLSKGLEPQNLPAGQEISRTITSEQLNLAPLQSRILPQLTVIPHEAGPQTVTVTATTESGLSASKQAVIQVAQPQVRVSILGPKSRYLERQAEWNIHVINPGQVPLDHVIVRDPLPAQLTFESATDGGQFQNGEVVWDLGALPAGKERVVQLNTRAGVTPGPISHTVIAAADYGIRSEDTTKMDILATPPALKFEVIDIGDPVEVGKQVTYKIEVTNTGGKPATGVQIVATLPPELRPVTAQGATLGNIQGQNITYQKLATLEPGKIATYTIQAEGKKAGDVRFEAKLFCDILTQPVTETESTTIVGILGAGAGPPVPAIAPAIPANPPPPPPPPGPGLTSQPGPPPPVGPSTGVPMVPPPKMPVGK
jgi:uncharacterized repeat protein (TIGR01451 family)